MNRHANSQISDPETVRLLAAALRSPEHAATLRLDEALAISRSEMLGRWSLQTPGGALHRVAVIRVLDGESMGFDCSYRDEVDALAVFDHLAEQVRNR